MPNILWWEKPMRIIQYNLQVADTQKMDPQKIAQELEDDCANAVVVNVGGIYAWYPSKVKYHHINEFLPEGRDLLQEILEACHRKNIKVIARFDFSKTDDVVYLNRPEWFVKQRDDSPLIYGKDRMGDWSLLISTCINSGYRNRDLAVPVIEEVLQGYDIDGIFFNAPHPSDCYCEICREKYHSLYGEALPDHPADFNPDWHSRCMKDNVKLIYDTAKSIRQDVPVILYYYGYDHKRNPEGVVDNLDERYATADLICTEAQNILSQGVGNLPPVYKPMLNMKIGNAVPGLPRPFGIIHSSPGMDWRHTGMSKSEYMFWMAQVVANNAHLWHSITGFNDTVTDKRILSSVREINQMVAACEDEMAHAKPLSQVLLLWNSSWPAAGWVDGMAAMQYQFDLMDIHHIDGTRMNEYRVVVVPDGIALSENAISILEVYVQDGGRLIIEKSAVSGFSQLSGLIGVEERAMQSPKLAASYLRIETDNPAIRRGFEQVTFIPLRKKVLYMKPLGAEALLTLVPPFAPPDAVGAPPERASMPVEHTDIPMVLTHRLGKGQVLSIAFPLSRLIEEYHMEDHYWLLRNCLDYLIEERQFEMTRNIAGLFATVYQSGEKLLVHLVNGIGQRPLVGTVSYHDASFTIRLPYGKKVSSVTAAIEKEAVSFTQVEDCVTVTLDQLSIWNMVVIQTQ
ncbi:family 10 glycosylhydrolase [Marasmitruncus massiliensis]|uniref:family 10 glycosylhydrolase n=1 Tax=Marasmitruncus massiliensis TaxID=1944642 RepID=UPI0015E0B972|nr:family 10 glycosylhydrolase [Marasmitruncus massiliensis]